MAAAVERLFHAREPQRTARHLWRLRRGRRHLHRPAARSAPPARLEGPTLSPASHGRRLRPQPGRRRELPRKFPPRSCSPWIAAPPPSRPSPAFDSAAWTSWCWTTTRSPRPPPAAAALVNPQLGTATLAARLHELCSAGLAFKLAHALVKRGRETGPAGRAEFDLRPCSTWSPSPPSPTSSRSPAKTASSSAPGLERLQRHHAARPGGLEKVAAPSPAMGGLRSRLSTRPAAQRRRPARRRRGRPAPVAGPRPGRGGRIAGNLDRRNRERQKIERAIAEEVIAAVRARFNPQTDFAIVEGQLPWHIGVVGIVASRVLQQFYRPTIILGGDGGSSAAPAAALPASTWPPRCAHAATCSSSRRPRDGGGFQPAKPHNLDAFRARAQRTRPPRPQTRGVATRPAARRRIGLDDHHLWNAWRVLDQLKPTGQGNPAVQFFARNLTQSRPPQRMGADKQHVKLWVTDGATTHEAVWWGAGQRDGAAGGPLRPRVRPANQRIQRPPHRAIEGPRLARGLNARVAGRATGFQPARPGFAATGQSKLTRFLVESGAGNRSCRAGRMPAPHFLPPDVLDNLRPRDRRNPIACRAEMRISFPAQHETDTNIMSSTSSAKPLVGILMGSDSDWPTMKAAADVCQEFGVASEARVISAHRTPKDLEVYASGASNAACGSSSPAPAGRRICRE